MTPLAPLANYISYHIEVTQRRRPSLTSHEASSVASFPSEAFTTSQLQFVSCAGLSWAQFHTTESVIETIRTSSAACRQLGSNPWPAISKASALTNAPPTTLAVCLPWPSSIYLGIDNLAEIRVFRLMRQSEPNISRWHLLFLSLSISCSLSLALLSHLAGKKNQWIRFIPWGTCWDRQITL